MNKDKLLHKNKEKEKYPKLNILIVGSKSSGKTSFIESLAKSCELTFLESQIRTYYKNYVYLYSLKNINFSNNTSNNSYSNYIILEFRESNSCELHTNYKMCLGFFENAHSAYVITDFTDANSFIE